MSVWSFAEAGIDGTPFAVDELQEHFHVSAFDFDLICFDLCGRIVHASSRDDIELPAMPGTCHDIVFQFAFTERSSTMETGIIDDMELSIDVEHRKRFPIHFSDYTMPRFHIGGARDPYELSHRPCLQYVKMSITDC